MVLSCWCIVVGVFSLVSQESMQLMKSEIDWNRAISFLNAKNCHREWAMLVIHHQSVELIVNNERHFTARITPIISRNDCL